MSAHAVRDDLVDILRRDLIGPMDDREVLSVAPSRWYLTGFLVPDNGEGRDDTADEQLALGGDAGEVDAGDNEPAPRERPWLPSSMGLTVLVDARTTQLAVDVRYGRYAQLSADDSAEWRRDDDEPDDDEPEDPSGVRPVWQRQGEHNIPVTVNLRDGDQAIDLDAAGRELRVRVQRTHSPGLPEGTRAVAILLHNGSKQRGNKADEAAMFQVTLEVRCPRGFVARAWQHDATHPDDRRNDLMFRHHAEYAVGHGVSVDHDPPDRQGRVTAARTTWLPDAHVFPMNAKDLPTVPVEMEVLAARDDAAALAADLQPLLDAYDGWIGDRRRAVAAEGLSPSRAATADELLTAAARCRDRIAEGIRLLTLDETSFLAFRLTQRAMADAARKARPDEAPRWRLFQLAFLLLNLPAAIDPAHPDRERVELLFFPTGGGKTEAYLGVAAFMMLHRRLTRGDAGAGVTVLLRYTLRLLTLDQLGRAATLMCALERIRGDHADRMGAARLAVGLWVGNKATPGTLAQLKSDLEEARSHGRSPPVPFTACPWCGATFDVRNLVIEAHRVRLGCNDTACDFHFDRCPDGLPVAFVDEHVYRALPAFLIATVDKLASLPWRAAAGALFGRVRARHPVHGFFGHGEEPAAGCLPTPDLPPPSLVIQDELHLISGPLGTMVGLYETAIDDLLRDADGRGPRIIASTATAQRAAEQVASLFGRPRVAMFPPPGPDVADSFFAFVDPNRARSRRYVGVAAPGRSAKRILTHALTTLLSGAEAARSAHGDDASDTFMTLTAYFNSLRELGGAQRIYEDEVMRRARRASRRRPLRGTAWMADRQVAWEPLELTSRQSTAGVARTKAILEQPFGRGKSKADLLLASSMISVGVDIRRLGLMVVHGQPRTTAEYIQATSRVGRAGPGLVVTLHNVVKPRDRSHYERFQAWHGSFYRYVESSSATPWAMRAVQRGLAGVVTGWLRHHTPQRTRPDAALDAPSDAERDAVTDLLLRRAAIAHGDGTFPAAGYVRDRVAWLVGKWRDVRDTTRRGGGSMVWSAWDPGVGKRSTLLSSPVARLDGNNPALEAFRAPTSMRDVEAAVHLWVDLPVEDGAMDEEEAS